MTYKIINRLCPENLFVKYLTRTYLSSYNMGGSPESQVPRQRMVQKNINFSSSKVWDG